MVGRTPAELAIRRSDRVFFTRKKIVELTVMGIGEIVQGAFARESHENGLLCWGFLGESFIIGWEEQAIVEVRQTDRNAPLLSTPLKTDGPFPEEVKQFIKHLGLQDLPLELQRHFLKLTVGHFGGMEVCAAMLIEQGLHTILNENTMEERLDLRASSSERVRVEHMVKLYQKHGTRR